MAFILVSVLDSVNYINADTHSSEAGSFYINTLL